MKYWLLGWWYELKYRWETRNMVIRHLEEDYELKYQEKYKEFLVPEVTEREFKGNGGTIDMKEYFKDL